MDLDVLNYDARKRMQGMMYETLQLDQVMHKYGMPGIDLPSSNPYRHLTKFDVDMSDPAAMHPAKLMLNSMYCIFSDKCFGPLKFDDLSFPTA